MTGTVIVIVLLGLLAGLCIRNIVSEHRRGELCECTGDCSNCRIQCQSNPAYYGLQSACRKTDKTKGLG